MPWIRLSDNYVDHPKFLILSAFAFRLWHEGMAFVRRHQTDGLIAASEVRGFRYFKPVYLAELATPYREGAAPLWDAIDGFGYKIHDYLEWNESKDEENERRDESKKRMRIARERRRVPGVAPNVHPHVTPNVQRNTSRTFSATARERSLVVPDMDTDKSILVTELEKDKDPERVLDRRAAAFMERYPKIYAECRSGAHYHVKEARDFETFVELARGWPDDQRLDNMLKVFLYLDRRDVLNKPGTPGQFRHHAPECDALLRQNGR